MNSEKAIDGFLAQKSFAVVGVSRSGRKFGNSVYRMLKDHGCDVYPVNPLAQIIEGDRCDRRLRDLPEIVGGIVIVLSPKETEKVVKEAAEVGIQRVWMQQGSESTRAIQYCEHYGLDAVYGRCICMFAEPVTSVHKVHRWTQKILHQLPE